MEYDVLLKESKYNVLLGVNSIDNNWFYGKLFVKLIMLFNFY